MKFDFILLLITLLSCGKNVQQHDSTGAVQDTIPSSLMMDDSTRIRVQEQKKQIVVQMAASDLKYFIIRVPDNKFGYTIFINGQMYIEQKTIPAIQGNQGFATNEDAEKIAKLAIE